MVEFKKYLWGMIAIFVIIGLFGYWILSSLGVLDDICLLMILPPASSPLFR